MLIKLVHFEIIETQRSIGRLIFFWGGGLDYDIKTTWQKKDKQGQFIIQPKTKHKTGLVFMKIQNNQTQKSKLRIPVLDKHFEVDYQTFNLTLVENT
jgi:hypothetical protein